MTTAPRWRRLLSLTVEGSLLAAAAAAFAVVLLPAARRGRERSRRLQWAESVREGLGRSGAGSPALRRGRGLPREGLLRLDAVEPELASWGNIGGCGVGGGAGGDVRWMGRRAPGGFAEVEFLVSYAAGEDLQSTKFNLKVSGDVPGRFNVGLQLPYLYSLRGDDAFFPVADPPAVISSLGDLSLLVSRKFGMTGRTSANLTVGIPTAPHDLLWEGSLHIPYDAQPGRGKWTLSLGAEHILERDYGPTIFGGSYSYNGGENDFQDYKADSISGYYYFSYKTDTLVHSLGASLTFALGKDRNMGTEIDAQAAALLNLQYGLELMLTPRFPLFVSGVATFSEKRYESYTLALGVVTSF